MGGSSNLDNMMNNKDTQVLKAIPLGVAPPAHLNNEGSTRRPRGRPAGSKNKPKPPIIITRDSPHALRAHALEITSGCDVNESLISYARRKQRGICILSCVGCVTNVTIRQPTTTNGGSGGQSIVTLHGRFEILSLLGSILPPPAPPGVTGLTVFLAGAQGQVVGGGVVGPLIAVGPVVIMAATFMNATFDRLPLCDQDDQREASPTNAHHHHFHHQGYHLQHHNNRHQEVPEIYNVPQSLMGGGLQAAEFYPWAPSARALTKM